MKVVIAGCGRIGSTLAAQLAHEHHDVSVIDRDPEARRRLPPVLSDRLHLGSGLSRRLLEEADVGTSDALVAVTSTDNANLVIARTAKETFRVPIVLAGVHDPRHMSLYEGFGIPAVCDAAWSVHRMHRMLLHRELAPEVTFGDGETLLVRSALPHHLTGRRLRDLELEGEIRVVEVTREGRSLLPLRTTTAASGDVVTFAVAAPALRRLRAFLDRELGT